MISDKLKSSLDHDDSVSNFTGFDDISIILRIFISIRYIFSAMICLFSNYIVSTIKLFKV